MRSWHVSSSSSSPSSSSSSPSHPHPQLRLVLTLIFNSTSHSSTGTEVGPPSTPPKSDINPACSTLNRCSRFFKSWVVLHSHPKDIGFTLCFRATFTPSTNPHSSITSTTLPSSLSIIQIPKPLTTMPPLTFFLIFPTAFLVFKSAEHRYR